MNQIFGLFGIGNKPSEPEVR